MTQYIKFRLPKFIPLPANNDPERLQQRMHQISLDWIQTELEKWASKRPVKYQLHGSPDAVYVEFERASTITEFMLTWQPKQGINATSWKRITIVDTMSSNSEPDTSIRAIVEHTEDYIAALHKQPNTKPYDEA